MRERIAGAAGAVVVSQLAKNGGKGYLEADGKPFSMLAWNQIEPATQGVYDWTLLDKYVTR
ncbi:hypothetical protein [Streptomyces muensis]|uniref:Uncharacterized protein n=1 Tax=Streptomyces muensis TaxID=1077944 RepID=A0A9X1PSK6_STRM4|nr:hypothetical protein [Streptomyces muensis]MCF1592343.1 hypothetical protein [Streptomyces muensis]